MKHKYVIQKRRNRILYGEFLVMGVFTAWYLIKTLHLHVVVGLIVTVAADWFFYFLFFRVRIFRWLVALAFSAGWGFLAFGIGQTIDRKSGTTSIILGISAFIYLLWLHKDHFDFLKDSDIIEYED
jgi:hypothetical protein